MKFVKNIKYLYNEPASVNRCIPWNINLKSFQNIFINNGDTIETYNSYDESV